ncbi:hypothetical protein TNCV_4637411 [Trichonephila clavipes]|nr:hypothetical protein TNCV_4637411 [Trichonephila clavipes]
MVGRHILEDIVGRVAQYVDEHYPVDKWHLSTEIAPHTSQQIAVCRSTINAGSDRWPVRLQTRVVVISTETESGFITEDDTSPVCHTPLPEVGKNPVDTAYDVGSVVSGNRCFVGAEVATFDCTISRSFVFLILRYTYLIHCCQHQVPYRPTEMAADTSIRPTCFSEAYYTAPESPSAARTAAGYVLEAS